MLIMCLVGLTSRAGENELAYSLLRELKPVVQKTAGTDTFLSHKNGILEGHPLSLATVSDKNT